MAHVYVAVTTVDQSGQRLLLLCQKNVYLVPHGTYEFAAIAANAAQYVLPGGLVRSGEDPVSEAIREFGEDTGIKLQKKNLKQIDCVENDYWVYQYDARGDPPDCGAINSALKSGKAISLKANNFNWFPVERAICAFGNQSDSTSPSWVASQVLRAMEAGFSEKLINRRVNDPHHVFSRAVARLILENQ